MKKTIFSFALMLGVLTSCFKDDSNTEIKSINPIVIDLGDEYYNSSGVTSLMVGMMDTLEINPLVYKEGTLDANLSFEWEFSGNIVPATVISRTMRLKAPMNFPAYAYAYRLLLRVTDEDTKLVKTKTFDVTINSTFTKGIVVADTRDEVSSDLSLVMSYNFNNDISYDQGVTRYDNVYSSVNGEKIDGMVTCVRTNNISDNRSFTVLTDKNEIIRGDHYDYLRMEDESGQNIFMLNPPELAPTLLEYNSQNGDDLLINGGLLYARSLNNNGRKFAPYKLAGDRLNYNITSMLVDGSYGVWLYDSVAEGFMYYYWGDLTQFLPQTGIFDLNDFSGWELLHMGKTGTYNVSILMKNKETGEIKDFVADRMYSDWGDNLPIKIVDMSSNEKFCRADHYLTNEKETDRFYYVTDNNLYSVSMANNIEVLQYTPADPDDKITKIQLWLRAFGKVRLSPWSPSYDYDLMSATGRAILVTTYNETTKEGKVTVVPISSYGGQLEQDRAFHDVYGGFGRILFVSEQ